MIPPTVHLNGTSKQELLTKWRNVVEKLDEALDAFLLATPHDRDFYVQRSYDGKPAGEYARQLHRQEVAVLEAMKDRALAIYTKIDSQA